MIQPIKTIKALPHRLNKKPITAAPITPPTIIGQPPTPVKMRIKAPTKIQRVDVSATEPGIAPEHFKSTVAYRLPRC